MPPSPSSVAARSMDPLMKNPLTAMLMRALGHQSPGMVPGGFKRGMIPMRFLDAGIGGQEYPITQGGIAAPAGDAIDRTVKNVARERVGWHSATPPQSSPDCQSHKRSSHRDQATRHFFVLSNRVMG